LSRSFHYMNAYSPLPWSSGRDDYRDVLMVLGRDPYEWKGYEDRSVPHLRLWPDPGRPPEPATLDYRMRSKITAAIRVWAYDERRAVELFRAALGDEDAACNDQRTIPADFG